MIGRRILPLLLGAILLVLQGGDCSKFLIADKQAHDCCKKGKCNRQNPDPCCQISSTAGVQQDQVKEKAAMPAPLEVAVLASWVQPVALLQEQISVFDFAPEPSPPGILGSFSLPLRV